MQFKGNGGQILIKSPYRETKESVMGRYSNGLKNADARLDLGLKFAGGHSYVVLGLKVDPKTRLHAEIDTQAQRSVGRGDPCVPFFDQSNF